MESSVLPVPEFYKDEDDTVPTSVVLPFSPNRQQGKQLVHHFLGMSWTGIGVYG